jgi:NAD-dependent dihydropyrimidine dehydrogenase PreA subunit
LTYLKGVSTLEYDISLCTGCSMCKAVCPHPVFQIINKKAEILDKVLCMECGACMMNCPVAALTVQKGVGCATAIISSKLKGRSEISCDCSGENKPGSGGCCC